MVYQYRSNIKYSVPAQTIGEILERIEERDGEITNRSVLDEARSEDSEIHNLIEWNTGKAAEAYRLIQAGNIIRSVVVVTEETETQNPIRVRAFVNVTEKKEGSYVSIVHALSDEEMKAKVISDAMRELAAFQKKYKDIQEFAKLFEVIDEINAA